MSYSSSPLLPKARGEAVRLVVEQNLSAAVAARKTGIHRSTLWRWRCRWQDLNQNIQKENHNRPARKKTTKLHGYRWNIPTVSSRPHSCAHAIPDETVRLILETRSKLQRCAEVVWHHLVTVRGVLVSLSSVRRILRRHHCFDGARKPRVKRDNPRRPRPTRPGELVQTDTIHHVDPYSGKRMYVYTVIDLYTRMAYAQVATKCLPGLAAKVVLEAQATWGFSLAMVQADNGPEYSRYFETMLHGKNIQTRHSRLHRPNDNAHIERFNRTIQTECIGYYWRRSVPLPRQQKKINSYIDYYNTKRVHLGIQMRTPAEMLQRS